jgi:hypothetical protein
VRAVARFPVPRTPAGRRRAHHIAAWAWFAFGIYGLIEYVIEKTTGAQAAASASDNAE